MNNINHISVVIPCHQCAKTIDAAVSSAINQTLAPIEIILVENGSTDETLLILQSWQNKHPNIIKLEELAGTGASAARNKGTQLACGEYIAFLDADDVWHPQKLELQLDVMLREGAVISGHVYQPIKDESFDRIVEGKSSHFVMYSVCDMLISNRVSTPTVMLKKSYFSPFDERLQRCEDWKCWVEIMAAAYANILFLPLTLAAGSKPSLGHSGLSANVGEMHVDMLRAIHFLTESKHINYLQGMAASLLERVKFPLRLIKLRLFKTNA